MTERDYEAGLRDGKIEAIEKMQAAQNNRLNHHDARLATLEKAAYIVLGTVLFIQFSPVLHDFFLT